MSLSRRFAPTGALVAASAAVFACSPEPPGQLMLAVQTDMSLPKDIDAIRIEVWNEGVPKFRKDYDRLGTFDGEIRLPGTLALVAPEKADSAVTISVSARTGGANGKVRVVRQVVTTVPPDRVASLQIPLRFVCDGSGEDKNGEAVNLCPEGQTCIAGKCADRTIDSSTLPTYEEDDVFAGGSCFDATSCWDAPVVVDVDSSDCTLANPGDESALNIGLAVEGDGICGPAGCFITLDAQSGEGWQTRDDGRIALPSAICEKLEAGAIAAIVTSSATASCPQKSLSLPTCGPWSAATHGSAPYEGVMALAGGQLRPVAFALSGGRVFFTNAQDEDKDGAIKAVSFQGGKVESIPLGQAIAPRDLVAVGDKLFFTSAPGTPEGGAVVMVESGDRTPLQSKLGSPEGIAVRGNKVFWTDFQSGEIFEARDNQLEQRNVLASFPGLYPYRLAADDTYVYVVTEGALGEGDGALVRIAHSGPEPIIEPLAGDLKTPRALALDIDADGQAKAVYFTTFSEQGTLERVTFPSEGPAHELLVTGLDHPSGIALDSDTIYWTNWGNGTVSSLPKTAQEGDEPKVLATGRLAPGAIAVTADTIYWVDEGSSSKPTGAVLRMPKPKL